MVVESAINGRSMPMMCQLPVMHISGGGPAGLAAAITCAKSGGKAVVHERKHTVGSRFHGDFQGQENWSSQLDILEELAGMGIDQGFPHTGVHSLTAFDGVGREFHFHSRRALFYLVRRGSEPDTFDSALLRQAIDLGVEVRFDDEIHHLPEGGICADGPRTGDVIAAGYQFETDRPDAAYAVLSDDLAPKGYGYLLVHEGRATLATCMFEDFHHERKYLARTVDFFTWKLGFSMLNPHRFGGLGNVRYPMSARKGNILYVGEAAGFQDALWGFGMRYAMISGHLAARAWLMGQVESYDQMWQRALGGRMRSGIVNRYLFSRLGNKGYTRLLAHLAECPDVRDSLGRYHHEHWYTRLLFPWASRMLPSRRREYDCADPDCSCTWCRCQKSGAISHG